jgi:hypothetical protein
MSCTKYISRYFQPREVTTTCSTMTIIEPSWPPCGSSNDTKLDPPLNEIENHQ